MSTDVQRVFVTLGSNIQPEVNLPAVVQLLSAHCTLLGVSRVWESAAVGDSSQANFCNAAVLIETSLPPQELKFGLLRLLEQKLGRVRDSRNRNAARTIDLDIALYGDLILAVPGLVIPDPDILERPFLLIPLAELDPQQRHPVASRTLGELAAAMPRAGLHLRIDIVLNAAR